MTVLKRIGNKDSISDKIIKYFPPHDIYIDMFFGAGGIFFNKSKAKHSLLNDINDDVFNFFMVIRNNYKEFINEINILPFSETLFNHWKINNETDNIKKAVRFIYLNNFSLYGKLYNISTKPCEKQRELLIKRTFETHNFIIKNTTILNKDFRDVIQSCYVRKEKYKKGAFIYADPPYLSAKNIYKNWDINDTNDLFDSLIKTNIRFAISELGTGKKVIEMAKKHNLNIINISNKLAIKKQQSEILITNYKLDDFLF